MLLGQAGPPSPGMRSMGRRRTINHDLPPRMARKGANYYYVCNKPRRWIPLGQDLARAKRRWAELDAPLQPATLTVACLVQRYIDREDRPHSTATQYASYLRCIAAAFPIPAAQLTSQHVALWRELPLQRARPAFVNGCLAILLAAYRLGAECGLCLRYPAVFAQGEAVEAEHGHTFRSPARDTWPVSLRDLRKRFDAGEIPRNADITLDLFGEEPTRCRACLL